MVIPYSGSRAFEGHTGDDVIGIVMYLLKGLPTMFYLMGCGYCYVCWSSSQIYRHPVGIRTLNHPLIMLLRSWHCPLTPGCLQAS